jgi:hypothetical protein
MSKTFIRFMVAIGGFVCTLVASAYLIPWLTLDPLPRNGQAVLACCLLGIVASAVLSIWLGRTSSRPPHVINPVLTPPTTFAGTLTAEELSAIDSTPSELPTYVGMLTVEDLKAHSAEYHRRRRWRGYVIGLLLVGFWIAVIYYETPPIPRFR